MRVRFAGLCLSVLLTVAAMAFAQTTPGQTKAPTAAGADDRFQDKLLARIPAIYGEVIPTVGKGLEAANEGYDGIIVIGPFNCLPYRISEAILKPLSLQRGTPILTYESDGYAVSPSFLRQVDVHIQQVLEHAALHDTHDRCSRRRLQCSHYHHRAGLRWRHRHRPSCRCPACTHHPGCPWTCCSSSRRSGESKGWQWAIGGRGSCRAGAYLPEKYGRGHQEWGKLCACRTGWRWAR